MKFQDLSNKKIVIWGTGKEGISVKTVLENKTTNSHISFVTEENISDIYTADILIKSPGVSLYRDEIKKAKELGIYCTSGSNIFFKNKNPKTKIVAVTGTKGKSTTASLIAHTLNKFGISTGLAGNIGTPLITLIDSNYDVITAELSSYQTADLRAKTDIAILTNLYPEHLQWHNTHEQYYQDKINLLNQSDISVINQGQNQSIQKTQHLKNKLFFNTENGIYFKDGFFFDNKDPLFETKALPLIGDHNLENATAVLTLLKKWNLDLKKAEKAFSDFKALNHRLQIIGEKDGVTFVDDSISTTPETAVAALKSFRTSPFLTLIVGGTDRGQNHQVLINYLKTIKEKSFLITLPDTGKRAFLEAEKENIFCHQASSMQEAVILAKKYTPRGGVVLLSPAAPSYNLYKNFEERGCDFSKKVFLS